MNANIHPGVNGLSFHPDSTDIDPGTEAESCLQQAWCSKAAGLSSSGDGAWNFKVALQS